MAYISQVKIGNTTYDVKAKALADEVIADLKKSAMTYKGPITQAELDKLTPTFTDKENGYVYTITDKENKEVVWYKGPNDTTGRWVDIGYDDAHAHSVTINGTESTFNSAGKVIFRLSSDVDYTNDSGLAGIATAGSISDPQHTHAITGVPSITTATSEVSVSAPVTGETPTYKPSGTISAVSFTDYATGINGASYTPKGSLTGGSVSIPTNKVVTDVNVTSDAIKSVAVYPTEDFDKLGLIDSVTANAKDVSVTGKIPAQSFITNLTKNMAKDFALVGQGTSTTASYTPKGSVARSNKILASVSGETLELTQSVEEATGGFVGTKETITSDVFIPKGKITVPANTYVTDGLKNGEKTITSSGSYTPSISTTYSTPWSNGKGDTLFETDTNKATTTVTATKNASAITCSFTAPTFSGTADIIAPTLKLSSKSVTPTFTGTGVMLKYTKATGATSGNLAIGKASTGITHKDPTFTYTDYITDITNNPIKVDFPTKVS